MPDLDELDWAAKALDASGLTEDERRLREAAALSDYRWAHDVVRLLDSLSVARTEIAALTAAIRERKWRPIETALDGHSRKWGFGPVLYLDAGDNVGFATWYGADFAADGREQWHDQLRGEQVYPTYWLKLPDLPVARVLAKVKEIGDG